MPFIQITASLLQTLGNTKQQEKIHQTSLIEQPNKFHHVPRSPGTPRDAFASTVLPRAIGSRSVCLLCSANKTPAGNSFTCRASFVSVVTPMKTFNVFPNHSLLKSSIRCQPLITANISFSDCHQFQSRAKYVGVLYCYSQASLLWIRYFVIQMSGCSNSKCSGKISLSNVRIEQNVLPSRLLCRRWLQSRICK